MVRNTVPHFNVSLWSPLMSSHERHQLNPENLMISPTNCPFFLNLFPTFLPVPSIFRLLIYPTNHCATSFVKPCGVSWHHQKTHVPSTHLPPSPVRFTPETSFISTWPFSTNDSIFAPSVSSYLASPKSSLQRSPPDRLLTHSTKCVLLYQLSVSFFFPRTFSPRFVCVPI